MKITDVETRYIEWLYSHIGAVSDPNPNHSHWLLAEYLYSVEFDGYVENDVNRELDGTYLRVLFGLDEDDRRLPRYCTVLEMLIAFSERIADEAAGTNLGFSLGGWFWHLMDNLGLKKYTDEVVAGDPYAMDAIKKTVAIFLDRDYKPSGEGGLFPLKYPEKDQREVELWYQMASYLIENTDITDED